MNQNNEWHNWKANPYSTCPLDDLTTPIKVKLAMGSFLVHNGEGENPFVWTNERADEDREIIAWRYLTGKETPEVTETIREHNVGDSDYAKHKIQPWDIWLEYNLNPWDADLIKRILRTKKGNSRILEYQKMIHICEERIEQLTPNFRRKFKGDK